jgi:branched-chain amino acid transport system permease protein
MMQFAAKAAYCYVALALLLAGLAVTYAVERSWIGYYLVAIGGTRMPQRRSASWR